MNSISAFYNVDLSISPPFQGLCLGMSLLGFYDGAVALIGRIVVTRFTGAASP